MSRARLVTLGIAVAVVAALAPASPAFAHDQLIGSDPSASDRLVSAPESVLLEYSGNLLNLDGAGAMVVVVDETGRDWVEGTPVVFAHTVTAELASGMPEAGYEIRWRVVSSDGHPISGVISFTIGDAAPLASRPSPGDDGSSTDSQAEVQDQTRSEPPRILRVALIGAGGAVIAVTLFALLTILRRRAQRGGTGAVVSDDVRREKS